MKYELIKKQTRRIKKNGKKILHWFEIVLGILSVLAVIVFGAWQVLNFIDLNWSDIQTYTYGLKIILELAIGIEVARMLFSYSIVTLIELAVFIVIRKMLLIEGDFLDLLLGVICLALLFATRHFFINDEEICKKIEDA